MKWSRGVWCRWLLVVGLLAGACSAPPYAERDSGGVVAAETALRYGTIGGAAVGGYFAGRELGRGSAGAEAVSGAGGAVAAAGAAWGLHKVMDWFRGRAYENGRLDGAAQVRAEILRDIWQREAVYGIQSDADRSRWQTRRVFVPEREVNGVRLAAGYQEVVVEPH